jgi:hypothetical protein
MELDKSIGDEPKLDTTELYGMICIEVEKIHQRDKITTLDQLMTAWNAKRELLVTLRAEAEIYNGMVGKFLPNGQTVDPILEYLGKSDHVTVSLILLFTFTSLVYEVTVNITCFELWTVPLQT